MFKREHGFLQGKRRAHKVGGFTSSSSDTGDIRNGIWQLGFIKLFLFGSYLAVSGLLLALHSEITLDGLRRPYGMLGLNLV